MTEAAPLPGAAGAAPVVGWLISEAAGRLDLAGLIDGYCRELIKAGVPLHRVATGVRVNHPQVFARAVLWTPAGGPEVVIREQGIQFTTTYRNSPVAALNRGEGPIRRRLEVPTEAIEYPVLQEVQALGATDYYAQSIPLNGLPLCFISYTTDRKGGFQEREIELLATATQMLGIRIETLAARETTGDLLQIYLGEEAARRVVAGEVRAGTGKPIDAVIWVSDLRGFTAMADRLSPADLIATLDGYFECTAGAVRRNGGEVLKYIGDGILAVFPLDKARAAMAAAREAFKRLSALNRERAEAGLPLLRTGIALNVGEVIYGNVGTLDRLDFTVIGRAVNETARIETLTKRLERPLLATALFRERAGECGLQSVGFHALPGLRQPVELFALAPEDEAFR